MKAYSHGISKDAFIKEIKHHQEMDDFIRGNYGDSTTSKGCAVGCSIASINKLNNTNVSQSDHKGLEAIGVPEWLAHLEDRFFENVSKDRHKQWPLEFSEAINEGADLEAIKLPYITYILEQNIDTLNIQLSKELDDDVREIVNMALKANQDMIKALASGDAEAIKRAREAAHRASRAADSAYRAADSAYLDTKSGYLAALSAAGSAYWAADSIAYSTYLAAYNVTNSAGSVANMAKIFDKYADKLLELIRECK